MIHQWIYQHPDWPNFVWDANRLTAILADVRHRQGRLQGRMEGLGFPLRHEANLRSLTSEVVKSSAIEGERLDVNAVRSSIARRLGIETSGPVPVSRHVEGIVEVTLDAAQRYSLRLDRERLFAWHRSIFPDGYSGMRTIRVGCWRGPDSGPMQVVSGPVGRESVHFEATDAGKIEPEMESFLFWFEHGRKVDPVLKAAISHLWFLTIHPFEDGNGRIARAISDMALARAEGSAQHYYSLSSQIEAERNDYYDQLERQQRGDLDISKWLEWFVGCLGRAVAGAEGSLSRVLYKARLWEKTNENPVNQRQRLVINHMLEDDFAGHMNTAKYARMARCSKDTALRDIQGLLASGVLKKNPGSGRSTSYRLVEVVR